MLSDVLGPASSLAARFNLSLPFCIVDVAEDLGTHALVQLRRALRAAIEPLSGPVRKYFPVTQHTEQQIALSQVGYSVPLEFCPERNLAGQQEVASNRGPSRGPCKLPVATGGVGSRKLAILNGLPDFAASFQETRCAATRSFLDLSAVFSTSAISCIGRSRALCCRGSISVRCERV